MIQILNGKPILETDLLFKGKTGIFDKFKQIFPAELVDSTKKTFEFDSYNIFDIFDTLNAHFFGNSLRRIPFSMCSKEDFSEILTMMGKTEDAKYEYYASYLPEYVKSDGDVQRQTIFIIDGYGKMTFKFAVSCVMHEMIHYKDFDDGSLGRIIRSGGYRRGIEHMTPDFMNFSKIACGEGLKIMPNGYGKTFDELNLEVAEFRPLTEDEAKAGWRRMVARLEAGEDIPGVALTPRGTVAFIIA